MSEREYTATMTAHDVEVGLAESSRNVSWSVRERLIIGALAVHVILRLDAGKENAFASLKRTDELLRLVRGLAATADGLPKGLAR